MAAPFKQSFAPLQVESLDQVCGGLNAFRLATPALAESVGASLSHPTGSTLGGLPTPASHISLTTPVSPTLAAPVNAGTDLVQFSANAAYSVDVSRGTVANASIPTSTGNVALSTLATQLAQQTGGAIVFGGDLNHDGRIGAADFLHVRAISETSAAQSVASIMDRLHSYETSATTAAAQQQASSAQQVNSLLSQFQKMLGSQNQSSQAAQRSSQQAAQRASSNASQRSSSPASHASAAPASHADTSHPSSSAAQFSNPQRASQGLLPHDDGAPPASPLAASAAPVTPSAAVTTPDPSSPGIFNNTVNGVTYQTLADGRDPTAAAWDSFPQQQPAAGQPGIFNNTVNGVTYQTLADGRDPEAAAWDNFPQQQSGGFPAPPEYPTQAPQIDTTGVQQIYSDAQLAQNRAETFANFDDQPAATNTAAVQPQVDPYTYSPSDAEAYNNTAAVADLQTQVDTNAYAAAADQAVNDGVIS